LTTATKDELQGLVRLARNGRRSNYPSMQEAGRLAEQRLRDITEELVRAYGVPDTDALLDQFDLFDAAPTMVEVVNAYLRG